jgi:PPP family 3-phenylpropionic acid transporter
MKNKTREFSILMAAYYAATVVIYAYTPLILSSFGYSDFVIGIAVMATTLSALLLSLIAGYFVDKYNCIKQLMMAIVVFTACGFSLLFIYSDSLGMIMFFSIVIAGFASLPLGLMDSWVAKTPEADYGKARATGSLSFAICSLVLGMVFAAFGYSSAQFVYWAISLCLLLILRKLDNPSFSEVEQKLTVREASGYLKGNKYFLFIIGGTFLLGLNQPACNTYLPLLIDSIGGTSFEVGLALFILAASEVAVMSAFTRLEKRFGVIGLLMLGFFVFFGRDLLLSFTTTHLQVYVLCVFQCLSFALIAPGQVFLLSKQLNHRYLAFALLINQAVISVAMSIANPLFGWVSETYGTRWVFVLSSLPALLAGLVALSQKKKLSSSLT